MPVEIKHEKFVALIAEKLEERECYCTGLFDIIPELMNYFSIQKRNKMRSRCPDHKLIRQDLKEKNQKFTNLIIRRKK